MSNYPGAIDEFRTVQNLPGILYDETDETTVYAEDTNNHSTAIVAIETELGTNPSGAFASVADRLANIDASATLLHVADNQVRTYASGGYQGLIYNTVLADTSNGWDSSNQWYEVPHSGAYMIIIKSWYTASFTAGNKKLVLGLNGYEYDSINNPNITAYDTQQFVSVGYFNAGDILKAYILQDSGSNQSCDDYLPASFFKVVGMW